MVSHVKPITEMGQLKDIFLQNKRMGNSKAQKCLEQCSAAKGCLNQTDIFDSKLTI